MPPHASEPRAEAALEVQFQRSQALIELEDRALADDRVHGRVARQLAYPALTIRDCLASRGIYGARRLHAELALDVA